MDALSGRQAWACHLELPTSLQAIAQKLPDEYNLSVDDIFYRHTLAGVYMAFLPSRRAEALREAMLGNGKPANLALTTNSGFDAPY